MAISPRVRTLAAACVVSCLAACAPRTAPIQQPASDFFGSIQAQVPAPASDTAGRAVAAPRPNFALPIAEIVGMDALINMGGRHGTEPGAYKVTGPSIRTNLQGPWIVDNDPFAVNQAMHPYQGAMYHTIARSSGLNYWQALAYTFAGSAMWELAGETTRPALNDQLASGIAGTFLGESLFRLGNLLVDRTHDHVGFGRALLVTLASPPTGVNRALFGRRFDGVMETHDPAYDLRIGIGARATSANTPGPSLNLVGRETVADIMVEYGLPGKSGYTFTRPFDYFRLDARASTATPLERLTAHGVLIGHRYELGEGGGGVVGIYGIYDYLSPQLFRVSTTAVSVGTSAERWLGKSVLMQVTTMGGVGYAAVETVNGTNDRDYHYGVTPQTVETFRLVAGPRVSFDVSARQYFVTGVAGFDTAGTDTILRAEASGTLRFYKRNGVTLRYETTRRTARFPGFGSQKQGIGTFSVTFTVLGPQRLGAIKRQ